MSCLSVTLVCCGQTVGPMKMTLGMQVGLGPGHIVLGGDPAPPPPKGHSPQFSVHMTAWITMPLGTEVGLGPGDIMFDGDPASPPQKRGGSPPQFLDHFYCDQTVGCIKMPLGMEVGLIPGDFVLDGDPAPLPKKEAEPSSPIFGLFLLWPVGCMKMPLRMEVGFSRGDFVLDGDSSPSPKRVGAPNFRPMSIAAKRLGGSRCYLARR